MVDIFLPTLDLYIAKNSGCTVLCLDWRTHGQLIFWNLCLSYLVGHLLSKGNLEEWMGYVCNEML